MNRLLLFLFLVLSRSAFASVDPGSWKRETLLGVNEDTYAVLVSEWNQWHLHPRSYVEAMTLEVRSLKDGTVVQSQPLARVNAREQGVFSWQRKPEERAAFDLVGFLRTGDFSPAFASDECGDFTIGADGLLLVEGDQNEAFLSIEQLAATVPRMDLDAVLGDCWSVWSPGRPPDWGYWFFAVRTGYPASDSFWSEVLIVVPHEVVTSARRRVEPPR